MLFDPLFLLIEQHDGKTATVADEWLRAEFDWSEQTAAVLMRIAKRFAGNSDYLKFSPTVLGLLSSPSVSDEAIQQPAPIETA